jgi:hypothetical protein
MEGQELLITNISTGYPASFLHTSEAVCELDVLIAFESFIEGCISLDKSTVKNELTALLSEGDNPFKLSSELTNCITWMAAHT